MTKWNWPELIKEQKQSGQAIAEFCNNKGIHYTSFYKNRKKLKKSNFVEIKVKRLESPVSQIPLTLRYKDFSLNLLPGFDPQSLKNLLCILGEV